MFVVRVHISGSKAILGSLVRQKMALSQREVAEREAKLSPGTVPEPGAYKVRVVIHGSFGPEFAIDADSICIQGLTVRSSRPP